MIAGITHYDKGICPMRKFLLSLVMALCFAGTAVAQDILKEDHPDSYVVRDGDTLWDIASMFLTDAWRWPEIWRVNTNIENPHLIYPGDTIMLTYVGGKPTLSLQRGEQMPAVRLSPLLGSGTPAVEHKTIRYQPKIRKSVLASSIAAIPLDAIDSLLTTGRIVEQDTLDNAPHILAGRSERMIFGPGDEFYARGNWTAATSVYGIFRKGDVYIDPQTDEVLGFEAREVGLARVIARDNELYTLTLTSVKEDVRIGDRLLPTEQRRVESMFHPTLPETEIDGVIMTTIGGMTQVGRNDVVAVNRGAENGLRVGDLLAVYKKGSVARDRERNERVVLPNERAGLMMIFRIFAKMSYGLILRTEEPLRVGDAVTNP